MILKLRIASEKHRSLSHGCLSSAQSSMWFLFYNWFSAFRPKFSPFRIPKKCHFHAKVVVSPFMLYQDCNYFLIMTSTVEEMDIEIKFLYIYILACFLCLTTVIRVGFLINLWQATTMFQNYWDKWALIITWLLSLFFLTSLNILSFK